jgi:hypothetical protein
VVDAATEQPVAGATVAGSSPERPQGTGSAQTGDDGRFELDVEPGEYVWTAYAEGYARARVPASVSVAGTPDLRFELKRGLEITGRLIDGAARPAAGVDITGQPAEESPELRPWPALGSSLPDGTFRFQGLLPGSYNLCAGSSTLGYAVRAGVAAGTREVTLTLRPGGRVHLLARLPDGSPAAAARGSVTRVGNARVLLVDARLVPADDSGRLALSVPAGALEIEVASPDYRGTVRLRVAEGETASAEVTLTEPVQKPK